MASEIIFEFDGTIRKWGNSLVIALTPELAKRLNLVEGTAVTQALVKGRHGEFAGVWKKKK